jgi:alpha/beta superfamily hydrolase
MAASQDKSIFTGTSSIATPQAAIRSLHLAGPAGRLEALLNEGHPDAPFATLLCHPHPKGGGTMHNKVVYHAAKVFSALGWPVLRFNFRGTGLSEGEHHGSEEVDDVRTGLDWLSLHYNKPIVAAGFSFGAAMGLQACCAYPDIHGFAALGLPTQAGSRRYSYPFLGECHFPKLFLSGGQDQFASPEQLKAAFDTAADPKRLVLIPNADHFFLGHLEAMQSSLQQWLTSNFLKHREPENIHP